MDNAWQTLASLKIESRRGRIEDRQWQWLAACLHANAATDYGQRYGFANVTCVADYQQSVPLVSYTELAPWITRIAAGEQAVLFAGQAVAFERTSGTTTGTKLIPYSQACLDDFRAVLLTWLSEAITQYELTAGCAYWSISPVTRQTEITACGLPIGLSDADYLGSNALAAFAQLSAVPFWVAGLTSVAQWHVATLYYLVKRNDIRLVSVWSPSFFWHLMEALQQFDKELLTLFKSGGEFAGYSLAADHEALQRLEAYYQHKNASLLWPQLKLMSCWGDASSQHFFRLLQARLPYVSFQAKGLLATEGVVTVPNAEGKTLLTIDNGFYEFIGNDGVVYLAHELEQGRSYEVVMTTSAGLYRYRLGDQVRCSDFVDNTPQLVFIGRTGQASDMVGEKLTEAFVTTCLADRRGFSMLFPQKNNPPNYLLIMDADAESLVTNYAEILDQRLMANSHYEYARKIGQLAAVSHVTINAPLARYLDWCIKKGQRMGDVKPPALCLDERCLAYMMEANS